MQQNEAFPPQDKLINLSKNRGGDKNHPQDTCNAYLK